jgi:hypothetical protein
MPNDPIHCLTLPEKQVVWQTANTEIARVTNALRVRYPGACPSCVARAITLALVEELAMNLAFYYQSPMDLAPVVAMLTDQAQTYHAYFVDVMGPNERSCPPEKVN